MHTTNMEVGAEQPDELLYRLVDHFIQNTQYLLDNFVSTNACHFKEGVDFGPSELKGSKDYERFKLDDKDSDSFSRDIDNFLSAAAPKFLHDSADDHLDKDDGKTSNVTETNFGFDEKDQNKNADGGYSIKQYELYKEYCELFEESMSSILLSEGVSNSSRLYEILNRSDTTKAFLMQSDSDDSLLSIFLEMVSALSDFQQFYLLMHEASMSV